MAMLSLSFSPFSDTEGRTQPPRADAASRLERTGDPNVTPGDDFCGFVSGAWLKAADAPAGRDGWTVLDEINERTRRRIAALLDDAGASRPGSLHRKVADFRAALLNASAIEERGIAPLAPILARIDLVTDRLGLTRLLGSTMRADVDPLDVGCGRSSSVLGFAVEHGRHGEKSCRAILWPGGLALGGRELYLSDAPRAVEQRGRYQRYIARLLTLAGCQGADRRAQAVLALEAAIAETHVTRPVSAVECAVDHRWSRADFARHAPGLDWDAFFEAAGFGPQTMVAPGQPSAVTGVAALVATRPLECWQDYLRVRAIDEHADVLPQAFAEVAAGMYGDRRSRDQRALAMTQSAMAEAIGELYAARYFSPAQKARVRAIIANVATALRGRVAHVSWLSPDSRTNALAKLDALHVGIGYPDAGEHWGDLRINANDPIGNAQRVADRQRRRALARLERAYDPHEWALPPQTVGAVLNVQQNAPLFAAAFLQSPTDDATTSEAATYGAIGAVIGHDMSHVIDVQPPAGPRADGRLAGMEHIADLAGLTAAFEAYRASLGERGMDREHARRQDREFFIAFAHAFGATLSGTTMRAPLAKDEAQGMRRMHTVRHLDAWYDAFDVVPGQRLYLDPSARVRLW